MMRRGGAHPQFPRHQSAAVNVLTLLVARYWNTFIRSLIQLALSAVYNSSSDFVKKMKPTHRMLKQRHDALMLRKMKRMLK